MRLLLIPLVAALALIVPGVSYSDTTQYEMKATGFAINDVDIKKTTFQIDLNQDNLTSQKGQIIIGDKTHSIKTFTMSTSMGGKSIKINGMTDDNSSIALTGRLVTQMKDGTVYETRGTISDNKFIEKIILTVLVKQKTELTIENVPVISTIEPKKDSTLTVKQKPKTQFEFVTRSDHRVYWRDNFDIDIKVFDSKKNPKPTFDSFDGTLDKANILVTIIGEKQKDTLATLKGESAKNGYWKGFAYVPEHYDGFGKYFVDVTVTFDNMTKSKRFETFLFAEPVFKGGKTRVSTDAGNNQNVATNAVVSLSGSATSPDPLTYQWTQLSGTAIVLSDATVLNPTFTAPAAATTIVLQLTASSSDDSASDTVTITVS